MSSKKNKLQKFAELKTFPNVYADKSFDSNLVIDHEGEELNIQGQWAKHFGNDNPITLEVACGKGHYTLELARRYPNRNFIGIDLKGNRLWKGASEALKEGLTNVAFLRTRIEFIERYFAKEEVEQIWITFPDPQLKKARKRTTCPRFLDVYRGIVQKDHTIHLKTDSPELYEYTMEVVTEQNLEVEYTHDDIYTGELAYADLDIKTFYELMHLENKKTIKYIRFKL